MTHNGASLADIRRSWAPTMRALGFARAGAAFVRQRGPIEHTIQIRALRNRSTPEILIDLVVLVADPFETDHRRWRVFTQGYLNPGGEPHAIRGYWEPATAERAHERVEEFALPFFDGFSTVDALLATLDAASEQGVVVQSALLGYVSSDERRAVPLANYEMASLLYWHKGDVHRAMQQLEWCLEQANGEDLFSRELRARLEPRLAIMASHQ